MPLTFARRIAFTYPSGLQDLHANFYSDDEGFYFASGGTVHAFDWDGTRDSSRDVTLTNAPTTGADSVVWGFTEESDGGWSILTRETGTGVIGMVRKYTHSGAEILNFGVQASIPTVSGETFRAPKGLAQHGGDYFVRVVRSVVGSMRFLEYDRSGAPRNLDLTLAETTPAAIADMTESNGILFITHPRYSRLFATNLDDTSHQLISDLETTLDSRNTQGWGLSGGDNNVYVADRGGYIYVYSGVPVPTPPRQPGSGGGFNFSVFSSLIAAGAMQRNLNERNRR